MKKICQLWILLLLVNIAGYAEKGKPSLRISVLTCAPGTELYSVFGHTALRITDSARHTDMVYNFGTFDFADPDFYSKFTRGKLDYFLSVSDLPSFLYEYESEKRDVFEQVLLLPDSTRLQIKNALTETLAGPGRYYEYDFLYNNCTTRIKDLLVKYAAMHVTTALVPEGTSFRDMLHEYLEKGNQPWSKLGIDLVLGSLIDKKAGIETSMFLPGYLLKGIDSAAKQPDILQEKILLNKGTALQEPFHDVPLVLFSILAAIIGILSCLKNTLAGKILRLTDLILFLLTGLTGCFLLFMWFGTDHKACSANYNLLWAMPTHLIAAFFVWKRPAWIRGYFLACFVLYLLLLVFLKWIPQDLNEGLYPLIVMLGIRSLLLFNKPAHV